MSDVEFVGNPDPSSFIFDEDWDHIVPVEIVEVYNLSEAVTKSVVEVTKDTFKNQEWNKSELAQGIRKKLFEMYGGSWFCIMSNHALDVGIDFESGLYYKVGDVFYCFVGYVTYHKEVKDSPNTGTVPTPSSSATKPTAPQTNLAQNLSKICLIISLLIYLYC
ncbi:hypothetical protein Ddc_17486 [Ditylenchus destructor]|nr:hypothetical protein Ddc_17486 [Ditylenchus destructor]